MTEASEFQRAMRAATAAARTGRLADARTILERLTGSAVNDEFFHLYLDVLQAQRDWPALAVAARVWQKLKPDNARALEAQATAAYETGRVYEAIDLYERALEFGVRSASRLATLGRLCLNALEFDRAARALDEAEEFDPRNAHMLAAKAGLHAFHGRFDAAEAYCRRSLARDPNDVAAYRLLGQLQGGRLSPEERDRLGRLSGRPGLRIENRITAAFALGDSLDAEGDVDGAFAAYTHAQTLARERGSAESLVYLPENATRDVDSLLGRFASIPPTVPRAAAGAAKLRPIFIVGMPRSGTTLVEGVLGAHSRVHACGERMAMRQIKREYLWLTDQSHPVTAEVRANFARTYLDRLPGLGAADHITDKNPWNFDAVGLILTLFPDAHVIHVRRNPVETGLSIFSHELPKYQSFAQQLEHVGHFYGQYARLMSHWERLAGNRMTTIQYEEFAADFDRAAPALVRASGLEWEEECRHFQRSGRVIATLSALQVRRPVTTHAGRAGRYERHLRPLVEALAAAGVDLATGAAKS